ncbi:MAG: c-type cytochrome [Pseudomonadota bacterium]
MTTRSRLTAFFTATTAAAAVGRALRSTLAVVATVAVATTGANAWAGDAAAGEQLTLPCQACHGATGTSTGSLYPSIGGQNERYLLRQLEMIKSGTRAAPLMAGQLDNMSGDDLANIAAYYAAQQPSLGQAQGDDASIQLAQQIYRGGSIEKGVAACSACHAPRGNGNAPAGFPMLSGQTPEYTITQLTAYREGARATDEEYGGMMRQVAANLNDTEIAALADYLRGLH